MKTLVATIVIIFVLLWVPEWYRHSQHIQAMVFEDIIEYQENYQTIDSLDTKEVMRDKLVNNLLEINSVLSLGGTIRDKAYNYRIATYELTGYLGACGNDCSQTYALEMEVYTAYQEWISDLHTFVFNDMYAMWLTK